MTLSVIIGSYNQARTLKMLLASLDRQTLRDFEVLIADDGSRDETAHICAEKRSFPIRFMTQADQGFRKCKILNEAIRAAQSDYLVFVDGDTFVERHFLEDHYFLRKPGFFICGRRVDLGPLLSEEIELDQIQRGDFDSLNWKLFKSGLIGDSQHVKRAIRISVPRLRKWLGYEQPLDLLGSNFSVWKSDLIQINGFNESFVTYWGEDGDLYVRLRNSGAKSLGAKSLCVQYHVFHPRREYSEESVKKYRELLKNTEYKWAEHGLVQRLSENV